MCSTYEPNRFSMTPLRFATPRVSHMKHLHFPLSSLDGLGFGLVLLCFLSQPGMTMELRRDKLIFLCSSENSTQLQTEWMTLAVPSGEALYQAGPVAFDTQLIKHVEHKVLHMGKCFFVSSIDKIILVLYLSSMMCYTHWFFLMFSQLCVFSLFMISLILVTCNTGLTEWAKRPLLCILEVSENQGE